MQPTRAGCGKADAQSPTKIGICTGGERCGFFMADLHESDAILTSSERFKETIDTVSGKSEDCGHSPLDEPLDHAVCYCMCHGVSFALHERSLAGECDGGE